MVITGGSGTDVPDNTGSAGMVRFGTAGRATPEPDSAGADGADPNEVVGIAGTVIDGIVIVVFAGEGGSVIAATVGALPGLGRLGIATMLGAAGAVALYMAGGAKLGAPGKAKP